MRKAVKPLPAEGVAEVRARYDAACIRAFDLNSSAPKSDQWRAACFTARLLWNEIKARQGK